MISLIISIFSTSDTLPYAYCEQTATEIRDISGEIPFDIPDSWVWVRLDYICDIARGGSPRPIKQYLTEEPDGVNWIKIGDSDKGGKYINSTKEKIKPGGVSKSRLVHAGDFLLTNSMSFGRPYILNVDGCIHDGWLVLSGYNTAYDKDFLFYMLSSKFAYYQFCDVVSGAVVKNLNSDKVANAIFPLPPIFEQKRIVSKIEELLPFIEKYDKAETQLTTLNATFPEALKKSILQEAVQGKLVPQNHDDEPASVLLEHIRAEKQALIKAGKIKKDKHESVIITRDKIPYEIIDGEERCIADEVPFELPDSWCWCRLGDILLKLTDGTHSTPKYTESGVPFISVKDVSSGKLDFSNCKHISEKEHTELYDRCNPEIGDILLTKVGTTGIPVIVDTDLQFSLFVSVALLKFNQELLFNKYLLYMINSPLVQKQAAENTKGVGNKNWVMRDIANTLIVIPPIEEQHRIVSKIEEIMPYIDTITK